MPVYKDPTSVTYDSTVTTGCTSIRCTGGGAVRTSRGDDGAMRHFAVDGGVTGTIEYEDPAEAAKVAGRAADGKDLTFKVTDQADTEKTVTITNIKTGGVRVAYHTDAPAGTSVPFAADGISDPDGGA